MKFRGVGLSAAFLALCVLGGTVSGLGAFTFWYAQGLSYFSNDPKACINCHVMQDSYDGWSKASHHAVAACNDCHVPHDLVGKYWAKAENGFRHSKGFTLQDFPEPIRIKPGNSRLLQLNCIGCHGDLVGAMVGQDPAGDGTNNCVRCHAGVGHGPTR